MGQELIHSYPVFRNSLTESARTLRALGSSWDLIGRSPRHCAIDVYMEV